MELLSFLETHPDDSASTDTDDVAREWIRDLGLTEEFPAESSTRTWIFASSRHPTHWVMAGVYRDKPDPRENGHFVICYPKTKWPAEKLWLEYRLMTGKQTAGAPSHASSLVRKP